MTSKRKFEVSMSGTMPRLFAQLVTGLLPIPALFWWRKKSVGTVQVFSRTDTHMTDFGCAVVARHILRQFGHDHDPLMYMEETLGLVVAIWLLWQRPEM